LTPSVTDQLAEPHNMVLSTAHLHRFIRWPTGILVEQPLPQGPGKSPRLLDTVFDRVCD
jgi:hypothetical protein